MSDKLFQDIKKRIKKDELLSKHATFRIGGPAKYFFIADTQDDLVNCVKYALSANIPYYILGAGSNILIADNGFDGLIIKTNNKDVTVTGNKIIAGAGVSMGALALKSAESALYNFEWGIGVPGTFGGAIRGNAGAYGSEIKDVLHETKILRISDTGKTRVITLKNKDCEFGYRDSLFKHNRDIVLSGTIKLKNGNRESSMQLIKDFIRLRNLTQGNGNICAGCIFQNYQFSRAELESAHLQKMIPTNFLKSKAVSTGWLIEQVELKGVTYGGARVSLNHGNFILNHNRATAEDVRNLIAIIKQKIKTNFHIKIKEEIEYVGF